MFFFNPLLLIFNLGFAFIILPLFLFLVSNSGFGLCLLSRFGFRSSRSGFGLGLLFIHLFKSKLFKALWVFFLLGSGKMGLGQAEQRCTFCPPNWSVNVHLYIVHRSLHASCASLSRGFVDFFLNRHVQEMT